MTKKEALRVRCIEGKLFQSIKFVKKHGLQKYAGKLDWYLGWLYRTVWSRSIKVDENKIVFLSFNKQYTCNPKYICEELIRRGLEYDYVWAVEDSGNIQGCSFPACVRRVRVGSAPAFREILSAKVIVQNAFILQEYGYLPKKKGQYHIQTWHGSLGFKRFDTDSVKRRLRAGKRTGKMNDLFISNSTFETEGVVPVFWSGSEVCEWGHARNDVLFREDAALVSRVKRSVSVPEQAHVVLYAPTYRDSRTMDTYDLDIERILAALEKRFGGTWYMLVKYHYANRKTAGELHGGGRVKNVSGYADIQELLLIADVGITDYSSWMLDYMLTEKPGFLYAKDITSYDSERGFYYPLSTTPFPLATTNDELEEEILRFDQEQYREKVRAFLKEKGCVEDGKAAGRAADRIEKIMAECGIQE